MRNSQIEHHEAAKQDRKRNAEKSKGKRAAREDIAETSWSGVSLEWQSLPTELTRVVRTETGDVYPSWAVLSSGSTNNVITVDDGDDDQASRTGTTVPSPHYDEFLDEVKIAVRRLLGLPVDESNTLSLDEASTSSSSAAWWHRNRREDIVKPLKTDIADMQKVSSNPRLLARIAMMYGAQNDVSAPTDDDIDNVLELLLNASPEALRGDSPMHVDDLPPGECSYVSSSPTFHVSVFYLSTEPTQPSPAPVTSPLRPAQKRARADTMQSRTSETSRSSKSTPSKRKPKRARAPTADADVEMHEEDQVPEGGDSGAEAHVQPDATLRVSQPEGDVADVFVPQPLIREDEPLPMEDASELPIVIEDPDNRWPHTDVPSAGPLLRLIETCWPSTLRHRAWLVRKPLLKELLAHRQEICALGSPVVLNAILHHTRLIDALGLDSMTAGARPSITAYNVDEADAIQLSRIAAGFLLDRLATMEAALSAILKTLYWSHIVDEGAWSVEDDLFGALDLSSDDDFNDVVYCVLAGYTLVRSRLRHCMGE